MADSPYGDVFQVVFHPAMRQALERWLDARGLYLFQMPIGTEDDLPTFGIGIGQGLIEHARAVHPESARRGAPITEGDPK